MDLPRDPDFAVKTGRILDLYERVWAGRPLREDESVLSTDEKTSVQARTRILSFQAYYETTAKPFEWKFTRRDLDALLGRIHFNHSVPGRQASRRQIRQRTFEVAR